MSTEPKQVYAFGAGVAEAGPDDRARLGVKGVNLARLCALGIDVPPGFTIAAEVGADVHDDATHLPASVESDVRAALHQIESRTGKKFGDPANPLLVAVRSGSAVSMPGMMATILNLGMNDEVVEAMSASQGRRFALDCHRRFLSMYGEVVLGLEVEPLDGQSPFDIALYDMKRACRVRHAGELEEEALEELVENFKKIIARQANATIPEDPWAQLSSACVAVYRSWRNPSCVAYRRRHSIDESLGTAVNVCAMVYGNRDDRSATGVAFTRDPSTGEARFFGEYLMKAQGEDVVSGARTPLPLSGEHPQTLQTRMPDVFSGLAEVAKGLEKDFRAPLDVEFTIESGKLWILQARDAAPSAAAAFTIARDMVAEGLIDKNEALMRLKPDQVDHILKSSIDPDGDTKVVAKGLPASPGVGTGAVVFSTEEAERRKADGEPVVFVRIETSADDVQGMQIADAILTARGGLTCHAAIVARAMGRPCIVGAAEVQVDYDGLSFRARGLTIGQGDTITVDGTRGRVLLGEPPVATVANVPGLSEIMVWVDAVLEDNDIDIPEQPAERLAAAQSVLQEKE